uniref:Uncharacterized protein n=1 Tax=Romanomermis culicivorax TaxID=13658 RepID=A0A915JBM8_ROMCU
MGSGILYPTNRHCGGAYSAVQKVHLYTCLEILQLRKDVTVKPNVECMQKIMLYMP